MALELVTPLPPGAPSHTRLARHGDRLVVLREILDGTDCSWPAPSPRLVTLQEVGELQGKRHALFEWVPGVTLRETLTALELVGRPAPLGLVGRVLLDAARALAAVQPPRAHGGLSDAALQVGFDGVVSVLDWGAPRLSRFRPLGRVNFTSDVFSLGAVLHSALTGYVGEYASLPPTLPPPSTSHAEATPAVDDVVMRALSPQADGRQPNLEAFADELEAVLGDEAYTTAQLADVVRTLFKERIKLLQSLGGLFSGPDALEAELPEATRPPVPAHVPLASAIPLGTQPGVGGPPPSTGGERTETRVPVPGERPASRPLKPWDSSYDLEPAGPADEGTQPGVFAPADRASAPVRASAVAWDEATRPGAPMPEPPRGGDTGPEPALQLPGADPEALAATDEAARAGGPRPSPEGLAPRATGPRARPPFEDAAAPRGSGPRPGGEALVPPRATGPRAAIDDAARAAGPRPSSDDALPPRASNPRALQDDAARAAGPRPSSDDALPPRASNPRGHADEALAPRASGPRPASDGGFSARASNPRAAAADDTAPRASNARAAAAEDTAPRATGPRPSMDDAPTAPPSPRASGARAVLREGDAPPRATGARPAASEDPPLAALGEETHPRARLPAPPPGREAPAGVPFEDTQPRARPSALTEDTAPRARNLGDDARPRGIEVLGEEYADLNEPTAVRARIDAAITNAQTAQRLPAVPAAAEPEPELEPARSGGGGVRVVMVLLLLVVVGLAGAAVYKLRNGTLGAPVTAPEPEPEPEAVLDVDAGAGEASPLDAGEGLDAGLAAAAPADLDAGALVDGGLDGGDAAADAGAPDAGPAADAGVADAGTAPKPAKKPAKKPVKKKRR